MDELLGEFLTETNEGLDQLDIELVRFVLFSGADLTTYERALAQAATPG